MEQYQITIQKTLALRIAEVEQIALQLQAENRQLREELAKANTVQEPIQENK